MEEMIEETILEGLFSDDINEEEAENAASTIQKGEIIIAIANKLERRVFSLAIQKLKEVSNICEECKEKDAEKRECKKVEKLLNQADILRELTFKLIRERIGKGNYPCGIRKEWKIVKLKELSPGPDIGIIIC